MHRDQDVEAIVQRFYDLMRTGGSPAHLLSPQLTVAVGTDDRSLAMKTEWKCSRSCGASARSASRPGTAVREAGSPRSATIVRPSTARSPRSEPVSGACRVLG